MATKEQVCARIKDIGILPAIRVSSSGDALFAAGEMFKWGIPIVELTMTVPGAIGVIAELARTTPQLLVGAGTVLDMETARACVDAGAAFITSPGMNPGIVEFTARHNIATIPGALTPTEVMVARDAGADLVKIFPCGAVGGPSYIKALRAPFPSVLFIASGGVDQMTAGAYIRAGAVALGIRGELIPPEAIRLRDQNWIRELSGRFLAIVQRARVEIIHG
jgi:2-dehydro-3-deoxyphosphogluconate aldolase/(4S)-4-hydroxy-2-oxoglutarate aldolase